MLLLRRRPVLLGRLLILFGVGVTSCMLGRQNSTFLGEGVKAYVASRWSSSSSAKARFLDGLSASMVIVAMFVASGYHDNHNGRRVDGRLGCLVVVSSSNEQ
jgi:hypothetical protein